MELYKDEKIKELFKLAQDFKNNKLWDKLSDSEYFAIAFPDGKVGYVRIIGDAKNNLWQLIIYPGEQAFSNMQYLYRDNEPNELLNFELNNMQDMIQLSFDPEKLTYEPVIEAYQEYLKDNNTEVDENTLYPNLLRYYPHTFPDLIRDETELDYMRIALLAQNEIAKALEQKNSRKLGFASRPIEIKGEIPLLTMNQDGQFEWSTIETPGILPEEEPVEVKIGPEHNELLKKLETKNPKKLSRWHAFLIHLPIFIETDESEALKAPVFLVFCKPSLRWYSIHFVSTKHMLPLPVLAEYDHENLEEILVNLAQQMLEEDFKPEEIQVADKRSLKLLEDFCNRTGIKLIDGSRNSALVRDYNKDLGNGLNFLFNLSPEEITIGKSLPLLSEDEYYNIILGPNVYKEAMDQMQNSIKNFIDDEDASEDNFHQVFIDILEKIMFLDDLSVPDHKDIYKDSIPESDLGFGNDLDEESLLEEISKIIK